MRLSDLDHIQDLAGEREQLLRDIEKIKKANRVKISIGAKMTVDADLVERKKARGTWDEERDTTTFHDAGEFKLSDAIRKLLLSAPQERLAAIERELVALGVEINGNPPAPPAAP